MSQAEQSPLLSTRKEEHAYQSQIRKTYQQCPHLFVTHCSDLLHLDIVTKQHNSTRPYKALVTRSKYNKYDIIMQIRGSIISYSKLKNLIEGKIVERSKLPRLLYLNYETQHLLSPKNIGKYLFTNPIYERANQGIENKQSTNKDSANRNCYIESHFGSKLLTIAGRDIKEGQQLMLQQNNYNNLVYSYNAQTF